MAPRIPLCCFVSDGSIVTIKIDPAAHVEQLRDAIFFKQAFNYLGRFPSSAMSLYFVQTSFGTWMTEIDHELKKMSKDGFCSGCKELRPTWHVQDYFKPDDSTPANAIHVLVILPPNVIVPREEFQAAMMKARAEAASIATEKAEQAKYRKQKRAKRVVLKNKHKKPRRWTKSTHFRIWCSVFEAGGVFSIKVCHDEGYFGPLRKVFRKQMYERIYGFRGYTMSLYLAQKANGEWLRDDLKLDAFIRNEDPDNYDDLDIVRLHHGFTMKNFCDDKASQPHTIHILVKLPDVLIPYDRASAMLANDGRSTSDSLWSRISYCPGNRAAVREGATREDTVKLDPRRVAFAYKGKDQACFDSEGHNVSMIVVPECRVPCKSSTFWQGSLESKKSV